MLDGIIALGILAWCCLAGGTHRAIVRRFEKMRREEIARMYPRWVSESTDSEPRCLTCGAVDGRTKTGGLQCWDCLDKAREDEK
jgi:hypothetical protein